MGRNHSPESWRALVARTAWGFAASILRGSALWVGEGRRDSSRKTDVFRLHRTIDGTGTYYPEDQPESFRTRSSREDRKTSRAYPTTRTCLRESVCRASREWSREKTVVSWWHSPHGDAPLSDYSQTFVADGEPRFDFPPEAFLTTCLLSKTSTRRRMITERG